MVRTMSRLGRNVTLGLVATGMVLAGAAGAQAQAQNAANNKMLAGVAADEIISILTDNQIQSQQAPLSGDDPLILALLPTGAKFFVRLQNCGNEGLNCQVVQYGAIFTGADLPHTDFNTFNSRYTFGKAYRDPDGQMYIHHAVSVAGGIRRGAVEFNMFVFFRMAEFFTRFLSERLGSVSASADTPAGAKSGAITNVAGDLPANKTLASFREAAEKHPEIVNKVSTKGLSAWKMK